MGEIRPLVKWAGGKTQLLDVIMPKIPSSINTYYEPFLGGGAVFFALNPQNAVINDLNSQLVNFYKKTAKNTDNLMDKLDRLEIEHKDTKTYYASKRNRYNFLLKEEKKTVESASLFLYLNKTGFNGLYRTNSYGFYNVPSAHRKKVKLYNQDNFERASVLLDRTKILNMDFEKSCTDCQSGDFVFFDSPYFNTFDAYQSNGFTIENHKRLFALFENLTNKGVKCMLTNSNEQFIKDLYSDYNISIVNVKRMINCDGSKRTGQEIIITNY